MLGSKIPLSRNPSPDHVDRPVSKRRTVSVTISFLGERKHVQSISQHSEFPQHGHVAGFRVLETRYNQWKIPGASYLNNELYT